jgi:hypothetical protein
MTKNGYLSLVKLEHIIYIITFSIPLNPHEFPGVISETKSGEHQNPGSTFTMAPWLWCLPPGTMSSPTRMRILKDVDPGPLPCGRDVDHGVFRLMIH